MPGIAAIGLALALLTSTAPAATLDESEVGDFRGGELLVLDPGPNRVIGSQVFAADTPSDFDGFRLRVPPGLKVSTLSLTYSGVALLPGTVAVGKSIALNRCRGVSRQCDRIAGGIADPVTTTRFNIADPANQGVPLDPFPRALPLLVGDYTVTDGALSRIGPGGSWSYRFDIDTTESAIVPLPAAWSLFVVPLLGLATLSRLARCGPRWPAGDAFRRDFRSV